MSFDIKKSFVSRSIVEANEEKQINENSSEKPAVVQEEYDPRTLYERLQEQRAIKEEKFLEESRFANQIKRIDEEEAEYFKILADEKEKLERQRKINEQQELEEYRKAVESSRTASTTSQLPILETTSKTTFTTTNATTKHPIIKSNKNSKTGLKGVLFVKKRARDEEEDKTKNKDKDQKEKSPLDKKVKTSNKSNPSNKKKNNASTSSLSLLSAYENINSSESEDDD
ncbi:N-terminal domain of NEFA-interacting nuclear protein NIP30-domain-containing protein [Cokeromyces recurvatus]|uniref:N-terminal domain of NEFA-interacting nuclear protein NIP30-domain-containing protein n=1 Tax=Cokeromyces recurvatus TaxID=90255 RepID=UPI00221F3A04|nr:N-terminal domain of NEFA-interacting nuclear protein NIP30-domain-containing protein [Cokeromyces recurvatus]KAI7901498.1 N-terminal domain of NEFA-interacting nuclear protein NIP30-domain-containing protein [Cokeromyces recurvatus]